MFIGYNRIWHFIYVRLDALLCGIMRVHKLPAASTFWRYLDSMGINQAESMLKVMGRLRAQVWKRCGINYSRIAVDIDTTVETIYGGQQGGRKGHNTQHRGKKGYRPVLCFIEQTREYLLGKLRKGETVSGEETARLIRMIKGQLPQCVKKVLIRADGEFLSWEGVEAAREEGHDFIFANKVCNPQFDPALWYRPRKTEEMEFNSCFYKPIGWQEEHRFVVMRIPRKQEAGDQRELFTEDLYTYRVFCTNLGGKAHEVIETYDKRADVENLIGEAKREGLAAIPSGKFKSNYAFFQIVMMAYNIWRYFKLLAQLSAGGKSGAEVRGSIIDNTIRIARLKLLMIAAKAVKAGNRDCVKYSIHDSRTPALLRFYKFLDKLRMEKCSAVVFNTA